MGKSRPEKIAVVAAVRNRLNSSEAAIFTEYRGLTVADLSELRTALRDTGSEYTIYKNRLVSIAAADLGLNLEDFLTGPTAIAFVNLEDGDAAAAAKVLRDFSKQHEDNLLIKGGVFNNTVVASDSVHKMADLPPREILLAQLAGTLAAPLTQMARLLQALPNKFAYALSAFIDKSNTADTAGQKQHS